jgi:exodeoxyribonuclease VII small subunit
VSSASDQEDSAMTKKKVRRVQRAEDEPLSFEQALAKLEQTLTRLEDGQLGLDESLVQYEAAVRYLKTCYRQLERAERRIELLTGVDEQGVERTEPFEDADLTLEQKQASRSRRRSHPGPAEDAPPGGMDDSGTLF